jgi:iron(III) transport system substrate-binding protein
LDNSRAHPAGSRLCLALLCLLLPASSGCWSNGPGQVVVYTALDSEFSEPIFADFQKASGVTVVPRFDVESTKTLGLVNALRAEKDLPRADIFWNNEIVGTLRLADEGLLEVYRPTVAAEYPELSRDSEGRWHGFAARARILLVNTKLVADDKRPTSIRDLASPEWRGRTAIAKPLFGTTATHAACLFAAWGEDEARTFFRRMKDNQIQIHSGNKGVAQAVSSGQAAFGLTDTDDALGEIAAGQPVAIVYPDRKPGELGTLFIPNTLAILKGCPHPVEARRLVEYLLASDVEARLAQGPSGQIPLRKGVDAGKLKVETPATVKAMAADFAGAAKIWNTTAETLREEFTGEQ